MKANLVFDFDCEDDRNDFRLKAQATEMGLVIYNIENYLRDREGDESISDDMRVAAEITRQQLYELISKYNVRMDYLI